MRSALRAATIETDIGVAHAGRTRTRQRQWIDKRGPQAPGGAQVPHRVAWAGRNDQKTGAYSGHASTATVQHCAGMAGVNRSGTKRT